METKSMKELMTLMEQLCEKFGQSDEDVTRIELRPGVIRFETSAGWVEYAGEVTK